jgi:hypothetical protein
MQAETSALGPGQARRLGESSHSSQPEAPKMTAFHMKSFNFPAEGELFQ